jgi:FKBP-type peptidyl-prolyl cis-trans isomerase FkpA
MGVRLRQPPPRRANHSFLIRRFAMVLPLNTRSARRRVPHTATMLGVLAWVVAAMAFAQTGQTPASPPAGTASPSLSSKIGAQVTELKKIDTKQGDGAEAVAGKTVIVHYTGWLYDPSASDGHGTKFDSSLDRKSPFGFPLGAGRVIRGWDEGVAGMKVGGKRTLVIPPQMGYGERGAGGVIPPNATLIFDVELLEVKG